MPDDVDIVGVEESPLWAIAYLSTPTVPFSDRDLSDLLLASRHWNASHEITGKLVVLESGDEIVRFAQWIEGPREELEACLTRITADPRHDSITVRRREPVTGRRFPGWDMAIDQAAPDAFDAAADALTGNT